MSHMLCKECVDERRLNMKKLISLVMSIAMIFCVGTAPAFAVEMNDNPSIKISANCSDDIACLAAQHLQMMKEQLGDSCTAIGFAPDVFYNMTASTPFTVYTFDEEGRIITDDVYMSPLVYADKVVGTIGIYYDSEASEYHYSLGTTYATELNKLFYSTDLDADSGLVIGRLGDKLFATDGANANILFENPIDSTQPAPISETQIEDICATIKANADQQYTTITAIENAESANLTASAGYEIQPRLGPNPIPIPHVKQTGVCGIAAWASVLNYRFDTSYTNATLAAKMIDGGYNNGDGGNPNMTDYKNFANGTHSAGCVYISSPPSFSTVTSAIGAIKPIMGCWSSGTGSDKEYHAIVITGYKKNSSTNYTYYVKNPWYDDATTITVTSSSNVVYVDGSYTWKLLDSVY